MAIPVAESVLIATVAGMLTKEGIAAMLLRRRDKKNGAGKNDVCIKHGKQLTEHDVALRHLCKNIEEQAGKSETMRTENKEAHQEIFNKLDKLRDKV